MKIEIGHDFFMRIVPEGYLEREWISRLSTELSWQKRKVHATVNHAPVYRDDPDVLTITFGKAATSESQKKS